MKQFSKILIFSILAIFIMAGSAMALDLGTNITIWDKNTPDGSGIGAEDDEVAWNCITGQVWDLEGFFLNGTKLTMVGGYDFRDGYGGYASGDIFIDTNGDAVWGEDIDGSGNGIASVSNSDYKYDYAIDFNYDSGSNTYAYDVYQLTNETLLGVYYSQNQESNPWEIYDPKKQNLTALTSGTWYYDENLTDLEVDGLQGTWNAIVNPDIKTHYAAQFNLDFLGPETDFIAHYTYQCGNDNLMGSGTTPVPEPATMLLFGTGLIGLAGLGRKKFRKS
jgi:hypothetical protein